jgi:hypothetical protein
MCFTIRRNVTIEIAWPILNRFKVILQDGISKRFKQYYVLFHENSATKTLASATKAINRITEV